MRFLMLTCTVGLLSGGWDLGWHQYTTSSHATTLESNKSDTCLPNGPPCPTRPSGAGGNCPVGSNSMGAAVSVNTGRRRAACGTMSVRAVRRLTVPPAPLPPIAESETPASPQGVAYGPADACAD